MESSIHLTWLSHTKDNIQVWNHQFFLNVWEEFYILKWLSRISAKIKKWKLHEIAFKFGIINFLKWLSRIKAKIKKFISLKYFCLYSFPFSNLLSFSLLHQCNVCVFLFLTSMFMFFKNKENGKRKHTQKGKQSITLLKQKR